MRKTIVIGIDAACLSIVEPWIKQGKLPHLKELLANGIYSDLRTIIPPTTPPAWTSLITGTNPGKHGITFEFFKPSENVNEKSIVSALDNKERCIWDYLSEQDMTSIVINVPVTHPPKRIKGIIVPGYLAPPTPIYYPPDILDEYQQEYGEYKIYADSEIEDVSAEKRLIDYKILTMMNKDVALFLARKHEWDFLMIEFQKTDAIFHECASQKEENVRLQLYQYVDQCVGEIVETLGKDANIVIVSDHGMGRCEWYCCLDSWLKEEGFLAYKNMATRTGYTTFGHKKKDLNEDKATRADGDNQSSASTKILGTMMGLLGKLGITLEGVDTLLTKLHLSFLEKLVPYAVGSIMPRKQLKWEATKAFCPSPRGGIRINLKGRDPEGIVTSGNEYETIKKQIVDKLRELKTPDGRLIFEQVMSREECYSGKELEDLPDILFVQDSTRSIYFRSFGPVFRKFSGFHHMIDGLFAATGPDIANLGKLDYGLNILDVTPTILHMMEVPVSKEIDGRVLSEIFSSDSSIAKRPIVYEDKSEKIKLKAKIKAAKIKK